MMFFVTKATKYVSNYIFLFVAFFFFLFIFFLKKNEDSCIFLGFLLCWKKVNYVYADFIVYPVVIQFLFFGVR